MLRGGGRTFDAVPLKLTACMHAAGFGAALNAAIGWRTKTLVSAIPNRPGLSVTRNVIVWIPAPRVDVTCAAGSVGFAPVASRVVPANHWYQTMDSPYGSSGS